MLVHVRHLARRAAVAALLSPTGAVAWASSPPENARPGTTSWYIPKPSQDRIAAYAGAQLPPGPDRAPVRQLARSAVHYHVFRLGCATRRERSPAHVGSCREQPQTAAAEGSRRPPARSQALPPRLARIARATVGAAWPSGFYLVRLDLDDGHGSSYASFVVRDVHPGPIELVLATNTWQAYNTWGGLSLYRDLRLSGPARRSQLDVAHTVTSRRPYVQGYGAWGLLPR